jgi:hypothetical protein
MTIQTQTTSMSLRELAFLLPAAQPIQADSRDYGFDFDEEELGRELLAPLPISFSIQSHPGMDADAFESTFQYFHHDR